MEKHLIWNIPLFDYDNNALSRAALAAQKVILDEIYLVETKTWRKPGIIPPEVLELKNKCSTEIIYPKGYKKQPGIYFTLCNFGVLAFAQKSPKKPVMKIEASFFTSFSYDLNDTDFKDFQTLNPEEGDYDFDIYLYKITPIYTVWPYWREIAQNMSTRMGFPALMVPMLKIVPEKINLDDFE